MSCPFARFAKAHALSPADIASLSSYHQAQQASSSSSSSSSSSVSPYPLLSEHLKQATAKAHRQVESSAGVRKLMGLGKGISVDDEDENVLGRLDYIRWMVMLGCIYAAMESSLLSRDVSRAPMLAPLLEAVLPTGDATASSSRDRLLPHLVRLPAILRDVAIHLHALASSSGNEEGAGMDWNDLVEVCEEQIQDVDKPIYQDLARCLSVTSQGSLVAFASPHWPLHSPQLTSQHLCLLSPTEAESTLAYVKRLQDLGDDGSDLLLSHAYVRYLGDLSGGQHIRKRVQKLFPLDDQADAAYCTGYDFYDFPQIEGVSSDTDATWHRRLKDAFRLAMDNSIPSAVQSMVADFADRSPSMLSQIMSRSSRSRQASRDAIVSLLLASQGSEASLAFELNKDLFEALIGLRPTAVIGPIPSTTLASHRPANDSTNSDWSLSSSSTSSVAGDDTELETDSSSDEEIRGAGGGESHSLLVKHLRLALASDGQSTSSAAVVLAAKASACPVTRAKKTIIASLPLLATGVLVASTAVLLKAALST